MIKKVVLICALVMLVSIVPVFSATSDMPLKKQTKLQKQLKTQDGTCTGTQTQDQTRTKLQKQLKTQDGTCTGTQTQDQTRTKLQKQLKDGSCQTT